MNVVGRVGSLISQGVYSVATPFHPFGGAVDIIVVQQQDGSFRTTPWYVRFGKFQGVLKGAEKIVTIAVNGEEANFHMFLDNSGEAYFVREVVNAKDSESNGILKASDRLDSGISVDNSDSYSEASVNLSRLESSVSDSALVQLQDETNSLNNDTDRLERAESDVERKFYDFQDDPSPRAGSLEFSEFESNSYESLDGGGESILEPQGLDSEVVLVCVDGHVLMAPISASEGNNENVQLSIPQFHLGPGEETDFVEGNTDFVANEDSWAHYVSDIDVASERVDSPNMGTAKSFSCNSFERMLKIRVREGTQNVQDEETQNVQYEETQNVQDEEIQNVQDEETQNVLDEETQNVLDEETQNVQDKETNPLRNSSPEDCSSGIKRRDIFKSCLELSDLQHVHQEAEDLLQKSPCSHSSVEVHEHVDNHGLSPLSTESPDKASSSDLLIEDQLMKTNVLGTEDLDSENVRAHSSNEPKYKDEEITIGSQRPESEDKCQKGETVEPEPQTSMEENPTDPSRRFEISLCGSELHEGMGLGAAGAAFDSHIISEEEFKTSAESIIKNENLIVRYKERYMSWEKAAPFVLGTAAFGLDLPVEAKDTVQVEQDETPKLKEGDDSGIATPTSARRWRLWPIPFRRVKTIEHTSSSLSNEEVFVDSESGSQRLHVEPAETSEALPNGSPHKQLLRTNVPTSEQIASLNLKDGQNIVTFNFSTRVFGKQQVDAHIYLWKWNARIVISDVDGTITRSDVLGQFMPLVGKDWTQSGVTRLFNAIKENGYQLLFLSARAIVQAYLTRSYLKNLKQDGNALPNGPVVISPDGLFPSLFREVIRRAPHEFKIACLEDIRALFPSDYNPFYAGFGNRDTDELSYRKMGIPKGKIFIINPKGEVAISHRIDVKSYTSLHTLVNDMFPPTSLVEQEDYNSWNFWRMPIPEIE